MLGTEVAATLEVVVDPEGGTIADPDDMEARRATLPTASAPLQLASGRELTVDLAVPLP